jgi:hypothetical protein
VIERRRIVQADVANAILIFQAKGGSGVGDDSMGSMGNGVREQREGPFLEQIVESTRHADRATVWPQTSRHPHHAVSAPQGRDPAMASRSIRRARPLARRRITRRLHDGAAIIAFHEIRGRQPMQPGRLLLGDHVRGWPWANVFAAKLPIRAPKRYMSR